MTEINLGGSAVPEPGSGPARDMPQDLTVGNHSTVGPMLWIGFYTSILSLFTFSIFRFWGRTRFRRRLWSETTIGDEPLEYTGRGMELFLGALLAVFTVMLPIVGAIVLAQLALGSERFFIVVGIIYLVLFVLVGTALFLARRYHLSRTTYRGVRFAQTGSAIGYGLKTFGYIILTILSLGWAGPWARIRLSRALWQNAYYGDEKFEFVPDEAAKRQPVYLSFALYWVGIVVIYGGLLFGVGALRLNDRLQSGDLGALGALYSLFIPAAILLAVTALWHEAAITRRITGSLTLGGLRLSSRITFWDLVSVFLTNFFLVIFTFGFGFMAAQMRLWKLYANRISIEGTIDFARIQQNADRGPKHGEGMADGFDLSARF